MKQLLEDLAFYNAEMDSALQFDDIRGYTVFKLEVNELKKQIKVMEELDKVLAFQFNVTVDNELVKDICLSPSIEDVYTQAAIKLAKSYAAHCMEQQRILCANNATVDCYTQEALTKEVLNTPLYNGENYGK